MSQRTRKWNPKMPRRWTAIKEWMSFKARWRVVSEEATRIRQAIAEDQIVAWAVHPDGRRRSQALRGWSDMLRSMVPA